MTRTFRTICCLVAAPALVAGLASVAHGHARLKSPTPRDNHSDYKSPPVSNVGTGEPCGVVRMASQPNNTLTPGAAITVSWEETVTHPGCFVIDFSAANDASFQILGVKSHMNAPAPANPTTANPRQWSVGVTLPTAPCTACTLRLRQLMLTTDLADSACPPATIPAASTYYSCANVQLGSGTGTGGAGGTSGSAGRGGNGGGGRGGSAAGGRGGTPGTAGQAGTTGRGGSGTSGQAGDNGQAGTSGQGQAGDNGQAGTSGQGQAGDNGGQAGSSGQGQGGSGTSGQAGDNGGQAGNGTTGQAGNGSSGQAGSSAIGQAGTSGGGGDVTGGCQVAGGAPAPLALLVLLPLSAGLLRRRRRRSRS